MKQRKLLLTLVIAVFIAAVALLGACEVTPACEHKYEAKYDETNHWQECSLCHDKKDVAAHDIADAVTPPTCTEKGYTTHKCKGCEYSYRDTETAVADHDYETKYDANGHWQECKECGHKTESVAHAFTDAVTDPTCTENGYTTHACSGCEYSYKDSETPAAHTPRHVDATAATLVATGIKEHWLCTACNKTFVDETCTTEIDIVVPRIAKVIVMAGQSNMVGHSVVGDIDQNLLDKYKQGFDNVKILWSCNPYQNGVVGNETFVSVKPGMGKKTATSNNITYEYFGPELGLAAYLAEHYPDETFYIIKDASGATTLNAHWYSPSSLGMLSKTALPTNSLYAHLLDRVETGMGLRADAGIDARIVSLMWMLGENDSTSMQSVNRYGTLWSNFVKDLKAEWTEKQYLDLTAGLSTIDAGITQRDTWTYHEILNTYKEIYASMSDKSAFIDVSGWAVTKPKDLAHLNSVSMLRLGQEFGVAFDNVVKGLTQVESASIFDGEGTEQNPYIIRTEQDFVKFAILSSTEKYIDKYYKLAADIGSETAPVKVFGNFTATVSFAGNFDGDNHSVWLNVGATASVGLFGYVGGATIANVKVYGTVTRSSEGGGVGGIVGAAVYANGAETTIKNCFNYATILANEYVSGETTKGGNQAGGIIGASTGNLDIIGCANHGNVEAKGQYAGGIAGRIYGNDASKTVSALLQNVANYGEIAATSAKGGIVGNVGGNIDTNGVVIEYTSAGMQDNDGADIVVGGGRATITHTAHEYTLVNGTNADCMHTGEKEHYVCEHCGKLFVRDGEQYTETTTGELVIQPNDSHDFGEWVHNENTETHTRTCSRNAEHTETANCTLTKGETVAPTFDEEGYTVYACDVCHATYHKDNSSRLVAVAKVGDTRYQTLAEAIAAAGNDGVVTLLADGETKLVEGQTLKVVLNGFALVVTTDVDGKVVNSNTDAEGVTTYVLADKHVHDYKPNHDETNHWMECNCGDKKDVTPHSCTNEVTPPTCTEGGYTTHTCSGCKYSYKDTETLANGHRGVKTAEVAASYATTGTKAYYTCGVCGKTFADEGCTIEIENLEEWKLADGVIKAQKDDSTFENSEENPFTIANATDYTTIATAVNGGNTFAGKYITLTNNIGEVGSEITVSIGTSSSKFFAGIFDGNGKTVVVNLNATVSLGLFGYIKGATIKNVVVEGTVTNTNTTNTPNGRSNVAGIVGLTLAGSTNNIIGCTNKAQVNSVAAVAAGIVAKNNGVTNIKDCRNEGTVTSTADYVGGIIGYISGTATIEGCSNESTVSGKRYVGGIAGLINVAATVTITDVTVNNTVVNGTQALGGIIGGESNSNAKVKYKNWTVTGCEFYVDGVKTEAIDGFDYADRKTLSATPGVYFGFIAGTLTEITD